MEINLLDMAGYANGQPYDQMLWLQENDPVHWHEEPGDGPGFWAVTRYQTVKEIESDPKLFSNQPVTTITGRDMGDDNHRNLLFEDPPRHTEHRKFLTPELAPQAVRASQERIDRIVAEVIDEVIEQGECDLVPDIAGRLASYVTADMLGLPRAEGVALYEASEIINNAESMQFGEGLEAATTMFTHSEAVFADRTSNPRDDMSSRLANGQLYGCPVDNLHFAMDFLLLVAAGGDTSRNVVSGGMLALFDNPEQRELLAQDPALLDSAVEEMLRWVTPIVYQRKTAAMDTEVGGQAIKAGDKVVGFYGAANRDPRVFKDPSKFDIRRSPNPHMAFGFGPHFCLGSHLARLELRTMFRELMLRMPDLEPAGPTGWLRTSAPIAPTVVGPKSMPVKFSPGPKVL